MTRLATSFTSHCLRIAALGWALLLITQLGYSQPTPPSKVGTGPDELKVPRNWDREGRDERTQFEALQKGERPVASDEDKAILDGAAKWYAYRLTQPQYQEPDATGKAMHDLVKQAVSKIVNPTDPRRPPNPNQLAFKPEFDKRLAARLAEVMKNPKPIARLNAAMILAYLAATDQEEVVDILNEIIQDPQENDGVKLYAFRGLKEFLNIGRADNLSRFVNKDREAKSIQVLLDYVLHKPKQALSPREGAALSYVRSEAVAALGLTRFPALCTTVKKKTTIERTTALALLRIMRKDGITPEPTVAEQVNAVVGLSQLQSRLCDEYQTDYAAYHIGRFLVDFVNAYNSANKEAKSEPWKIHTARLAQALDDLQTEAGRTNAKAYVTKFVAQAQGPLTVLINGKEQPRKDGLESWLNTNAPTSKTLYKDVPDSVVKEVERPADQ